MKITPLNITEALVSSGFPHVEVTTPSTRNKNLAFECIMVSEVIAKRIPMLDDLRQGLISESVLGFNVLSLTGKHAHRGQATNFPPYIQ